ncbi:PREDICTED: vacuolar protein sorting-associated protein 13D-like [Priapulus caudatus]|uniref:Vacuolar protein sorting-associated protein 13D-like n=1 Tax=Priapulus caudatus TaxID=37621 RepID=A0ABM1E115_PRICU|nr:PREDICTED: vacuolar protein sorting-associated protein 13D-like [Priapulus caudatus]
MLHVNVRSYYFQFLLTVLSACGRLVAHGVSNSTAKFTGSLSDTLGKVSMDQRHQEMREEVRVHSGSSGAHLKAGLQGLGIGVVGGLAGVFMQPIEGAAKDGVAVG